MSKVFYLPAEIGGQLFLSFFLEILRLGVSGPLFLHCADNSGEAFQTRQQFEDLNAYDQDSLIEFLKTLRVLPPCTLYLVVDENFHEKRWPPLSRSSVGSPSRLLPPPTPSS